MSTNLSAASFERDVSQFLQVMDLSADEFVRRLALQCWNGFVARNPVDTGRSADGYDIAQNEPSDYLPPEIPQDVQDTRQQMREMGMTPGRIIPPPETPDVSGITAASPVYVTNLVDYVPELEMGSSAKAPSGMIAVTLAEVETHLDELILQSARAAGGALP